MTPERRKLPETIEQAIVKTTDNCWLITFILLLNSPGQFNSKEREKITTTTKEVLGINFWRTAGKIGGDNFEGLRAISSSPKKALSAYSQILNTIDRVISTPPPSQDQPSFLHLQQLVIKASFAGALYWLAYKNGGLETCQLFARSPIAKVDHHGVWEKEIKVLTGIDRTIDEAAEVLKSFGISNDEAEENLTKWFERFSAEVTNASLSKAISSKKETREFPPFIYRLLTLSVIAASLSSSGTTKIDEQTLRKALIQERPVVFSTGFDPIREEEERQRMERAASPPPKTSPVTTVPSEIPPQITATGKDGEIRPAPEISIEKNEAFHVVESGDLLPKIVKGYWYKDAEGPMVAGFSRVLLMINPHLGKDPNKIEVGKRVFVYPDQMKGKFAEVLVFLLEGKGKLEDLRKLIKDLAITPISSQNEFVSASEKGKWLIYENKEQLPLEKILRLYFGAFGEKTLSLINRINHMKMLGQDVVPLLVLPPPGWLSFQIENNSLPPAIVIPKIDTTREAQEKQPVPQTSPTPAVTTTEKNPAPETITYVVKQGDSLGAIAKKYGTTTNAIVQVNGIANPNLILVGQRLRIPGKENPPKDTPKTIIPPSTPTKEPAKGALPVKIDPGQSLDQLRKKGSPEIPTDIQNLIQEFQKKSSE